MSVEVAKEAFKELTAIYVEVGVLPYAID